MTADLSLTDRSTWIAILSVVAAVLSDIFHHSFSPYVPTAATIAAGLVVAFVLLAKHHYQAAITAAASTLSATAPAVTTVLANPAVGSLGMAIKDASTALAQAPDALITNAAAPAASGPSTAAPAAPPAPPPAAPPVA